MKYLALILLLQFSVGAIAAEANISSNVQEITAGLFDSSPGSDFGKKVISFVAGGGGSYMEQSLLSTVSRFINLGALSVMAWLAVIGAATFVIQTGNKGTPGGQVISSFWMPIRISTAVILLIPLSSGYSTLQYGVISAGETSNDFGNVVSEAGLNFLYENGSYRAPAIQDGSSIMLSWVAAEVCKQYINATTNHETIKSEFRTRTDHGADGSVSRTSGYYYDHSEPGNSAHKSAPRLNYCGNVEFSVTLQRSVFADTDGKTTTMSATMSAMPVALAARAEFDEFSVGYAGPRAIAEKHKELLQTLQPKVAEIASMILSDQDALKQLQESGSSAQSAFAQARAEANGSGPLVLRKITSLVHEYNQLAQQAVATAVNNIVDNKREGQQAPWTKQIKEAGWPALGTIFWQQQMSQMHINRLGASFTPTVIMPVLDNDFSGDERLAEINARLSGLMSLKRYSGESAGNISFDMYDLSAIADAGAEGRGYMDAFKKMCYDIVAYLFKQMAFRNGDDPIINLQYFGTTVGSVAENAYWVKTIATSALVGLAAAASHGADGLKNSADNFFLGLGAIAGAPSTAATAGLKGVLAAMQHFFSEVGPFFNMLLMYFIIIGLVLGVVLPTIPLIQWFMGFISWLLFFIECLLVSPMWLAAHGTAEKEGWGSEHTRQGYMLMIGLLLSPALRVAGFFAIFLLMRPIGVLMGWMIDYIGGVVVSGFINPFLLIGSMGVVTIFAYTAMVRCFVLPSELFERGLRWINGGQEVTGDTQAERETRNVIASFSHKSESAGALKGKGNKPYGGLAEPSAGKQPGENPASGANKLK